MAEFPAMPLWTDAYLGDTTHLTTIEHGSYLLLLIAMWRTNDASLPNDDKLLARYAKLTKGQWNRIKPVLMPFFTVDGDRITQGRLTDESIAVRQKSARQSDKAKSRWLKNNKTNDATAMPDGCRDDASLTLNPYPIEDTKVSSGENSSHKNPKPKRQSKRSTAISYEWVPSDRNVSDARAKGLDRHQIDSEAQRFRDHHLAKGSTMKDWDAAWRTWISNAEKWGLKPNAGINSNGKRVTNAGAFGLLPERC